MLYGGHTIKEATRQSSWVALATPIGALGTYFLLRNIDRSFFRDFTGNCRRQFFICRRFGFNPRNSQKK